LSLPLRSFLSAYFVAKIATFTQTQPYRALLAFLQRT